MPNEPTENNTNYEEAIADSAIEYFKKNLFLVTAAAEEEKEAQAAAEQSSDSNSDSEPETDIDVVEQAQGILAGFPIDKTQFSPARNYTPKHSIFSPTQDINLSLNALVFATKLAFFNIDPKSNSYASILKEVSSDSFGYMNILRTNQVKVLKDKQAKLQEKLDYLHADKLNNSLRFLTQKRRELNLSKQKYLGELINFYALNILPDSFTLDVRQKMIEQWLSDKI